MTQSAGRFLSGPVQFFTHLGRFRSYSRYLEISTYRCGFSFRFFDCSIQEFDASIHEFGCSIHVFDASIHRFGSSFRRPGFFP